MLLHYWASRFVYSTRLYGRYETRSGISNAIWFTIKELLAYRDDRREVSAVKSRN